MDQHRDLARFEPEREQLLSVPGQATPIDLAEVCRQLQQRLQDCDEHEPRLPAMPVSRTCRSQDRYDDVELPLLAKLSVQQYRDRPVARRQTGERIGAAGPQYVGDALAKAHDEAGDLPTLRAVCGPDVRRDRKQFGEDAYDGSLIDSIRRDDVVEVPQTRSHTLFVGVTPK